MLGLREIEEIKRFRIIIYINIIDLCCNNFKGEQS